MRGQGVLQAGRRRAEHAGAAVFPDQAAGLALGGGLGLAAGLAPSSAEAATQGAGKRGIEALNLEDPKARARLNARIKGSSAEETVYTFCRLHLYLYMNDGNLIPAVSMQNLNVAQWKPLPNGNYAGTVREVQPVTQTVF